MVTSPLSFVALTARMRRIRRSSPCLGTVSWTLAWQIPLKEGVKKTLANPNRNAKAKIIWPNTYWDLILLLLIPWPDGSSLQEFDAICPLANQLVVKLFNIYHQILDCGPRVRWNYFPSLAVEIFRPKCRIVGNEVKLVLAIFIPTRVAMLPSG